jgi:hypothetical protein
VHDGSWGSHRYIGEFVDGKYNGNGIQYSKNSDLPVRIGKFNNDRYVSGSGKEVRNQVVSSETPQKPPVNPNALPLCPRNYSDRYHNCWGSNTDTTVKYLGEWQNDQSNGFGSESSPLGRYVGYFLSFLPEGQGIYILKDGAIRIGEFKRGNLHGRGIIYNRDGSIREQGIYKEGRLVATEDINMGFMLPIFNSIFPSFIEAQRVAEERGKLEDDKRQREQSKKSSLISITASSTQPDSSGIVTINIQTNTDTSSLKINGEELGGKADGSYSVKRVARVGQETKFILAATDVYGNTDTK